MQAQRKSQERYSSVKKFGGIVRDDITVATASQDYLAWFRNERKSVGTTQNTVDAHILPAFGDRTAASLRRDAEASTALRVTSRVCS